MRRRSSALIYAALVMTLPALASAQPRSRLVSTASPDLLAQVSGVVVRTCRSGLCTIDVDPSFLNEAELRDLTDLRERSGRRRPMLDRSVPASGVTEALVELGLDGSGVMIAIIDSGLDWRHPDFDDGEGGSRIELIADLSHVPQGLHPELEATLGAAVWRNADIEEHLSAEARGEDPRAPVLQRDTFGHGTHVASTAAGSRGVAPGATIVAVRASRQEWPVVFEDADVIDAARFVFDQAEVLGMPAVIVLALGGHEGPHDGTSLLELALSDLVGDEHPGRAIVVAAGNSGGADEHASGDPRGGELDVVLEFPNEDASLAADLEIWSSDDADLTISVTTPEGDRLGPLHRGEQDSRSLDAAWIELLNATDLEAPSNGDQRAVVSFRARVDAPIEPGRYRITISGRGRFDAYLTWASTEQLSGGARLLTQLDPDGTLTVPGTAPELITVGASVSRRVWTDLSGRVWSDDRYTVGDVAPYSGSGPNRVGDVALDLVAPGHVIIAALSQDAVPPIETSIFTPRTWLTPDDMLVVAPGDRAVLWGTSLSTPHVAGVVALLLQLDPDLTQDRIRAVLRASARTGGGAAGAAWSPRWGIGELDAERAVDVVRNGFSTDAAPAADESALGVSADVVAPESCATIFVTPKDADGHPLGPNRSVSVFASMGTLTAASDDDGDGISSSTWCAENVRAGEPVDISATIDGVTLTRTAVIHVAYDRRDLGGWLHASGGCQAASTRSFLGLAALVRLLYI